MYAPFILISVVTRQKKFIAVLVCKYSNSSVCRTGSAVESVCGWILRLWHIYAMQELLSHRGLGALKARAGVSYFFDSKTP
jgi:hypothetical protein